MRKLEQGPTDVRVEIVTPAFVASGVPEGVRSLDRFIELLNSDIGSRHIEIMETAVRPLYRATDELHLDVPLLVRRDEIVFANFEGPTSADRAERQDRVDAPILLLAPPFQIQACVSLAAGANPTQALRPLMIGFFAVRKAHVFDTDGAPLGEGEQIIVNGATVQMASSTARHIEVAATPIVARGPRAVPDQLGEQPGEAERAA